MPDYDALLALHSPKTRRSGSANCRFCFNHDFARTPTEVLPDGRHIHEYRTCPTCWGGSSSKAAWPCMTWLLLADITDKAEETALVFIQDGTPPTLAYSLASAIEGDDDDSPPE